MVYSVSIRVVAINDQCRLERCSMLDNSYEQQGGAKEQTHGYYY